MVLAKPNNASAPHFWFFTGYFFEQFKQCKAVVSLCFVWNCTYKVFYIRVVNSRFYCTHAKIVPNICLFQYLIGSALGTIEIMSTTENKPLEGTKLADFKPGQPVDSLGIEDVKDGTGETVQPNATISAHYTGALVTDGTIFQSSYDSGEPVTFGLNQVIPGWTLGVPGMKVGGIRRLTIPATQAYGERSPSPNIPPNSDLVFDIELVAIQ